jgi:cytochrome c5
MKLHMSLILILAASLFGLPLLAYAEGNWRTGRVYYRMVCTACHVETSAGSIAPATKTKAEWAAYIEADKHAKGKDSLKYYVSKEYRDSIKATNKAAERYSTCRRPNCWQDVKAFVIHGAKDSDTPAGCN